MSIRFWRCFEIAISAIFLPLLVSGQYSNEWIDYSQTYYKIPVARDGMYRLTHTNLVAAGVPVGTIDPRRIQLFHRGAEQSILVQGQADASFDPADYIEFYGKRNDGTLDADLYKPSSLQPHSYYNLYSDTTSYFLTWNNSAVAGKRMNNFSEVNVTGIPIEPAHNLSRISVFSSDYSGGNTISTYLQLTQFDEGEGWTGPFICTGNTGCNGFSDFVIDQLTNRVTTAGNPQLKVMLVGRDALAHQAEIWVGPNVGSLRLVDTKSFLNFQTALSNVSINWSDIGLDGRVTVRVRALGVGGNRERLSAMYINIVMPQNFDMASLPEKIFQLDANPLDKSYIEIANPSANARILDVTNPTNITIVGAVLSGTLKAVVPNTITSRKLLVTNTFTTPSIRSIKLRQIDAPAHNFIIISNKQLMQPALGYADPVKAYGGYRASVEGGGYDTLVVSVDQLYDQFNYGEISARALFQFVKYMHDQGEPKYLFLIGKGLGIFYGYHRKTSFTSADLHDLVPTAGNPGSDMAYSAGLGATTYEPAIPTGRITASTSAQVAQYLNKIIEHEALPFNELWRRDLLHLSGGIQAFELATFLGYMNGYKQIAEGEYLGGNVSTIAKQEASPVELINISDEVNSGLNLITFFGHSSPSTIDIDIGFVTDPTMGYNNKGKYPSFLINGCNAGLFFLNTTLFGEDWILANEKGAKSFIAHSSYGFSSTLNFYSDLFYTVGYGDSVFVNRGIGDVQKEVARRYMASTSPTISHITQVQQMVLLGDPAVKLFGATKPDYETSDGAITIASFDGKPITALTDSFAVKAIVRNFGVAPQDPITVRLTRTFSDNTSISYDTLFPGVFYRDTLILIVHRGTQSGSGNNEIQIWIDPDNAIDELDNDNNTGRRNIFIPLNGTLNLFPKSYDIVSSSVVNLVWQSTDLLSTTRDYQLELDTVNTFDSPFLQQKVINAGVVASQSFSLPNIDSLAYFWRTKLNEPLPGESETWTTSSFSYMDSSPEGWAQIDFAQHLENSVIGLRKDQSNKKLAFLETITGLEVHTYGSNHAAPATSVSVKINSAEYNLAVQGQPCRDNTINFIAFNKSTAVPYAGIPFVFQDARTCGRTPQIINSFRLPEIETGNNDDVSKFIDNLGVSDSVILFSIGNPTFTGWSSTVLTKLGDIGISSAQITSLVDGEPVVIRAKKGAAAGTATVFKTSAIPPEEQDLLVASTISGRHTSGSMLSTRIGPAVSWDQFVVNMGDVDPSDQYEFSIRGVDLLGFETVIQNGITGNFDLSNVDASSYPFLMVEINLSDAITQTPVQVNKWFVFYESAAEGLLVYNGTLAVESVAEGAPWNTSFAFTNISSKSFSDSLTVNLEVFNQASSKLENTVFKIEAPLPGDTTRFDVSTTTVGKAGLNDVNVFVNKRVLPELYYDNNVIELRNRLHVAVDEIRPVLDVTFDGRHLTSGDAVSHDPLIHIKLIDENIFLRKVDTVGVFLFMEKSCSGVPCINPIYLSDPSLTWSPATALQPFQIEYKPHLDTSQYKLIIDVQDATGNRSGEEPYEVSFVVSDEQSIVLFPPFPNPSSDEFYFKFRIAGSEPPDDISLRIMSLDGRTVNNYSVNSSGFFVGTNSLTWESRDEHGNLLPAGLYAYQLVLSAGGQVAKESGRLVVIR